MPHEADIAYLIFEQLKKGRRVVFDPGVGNNKAAIVSIAQVNDVGASVVLVDRPVTYESMQAVVDGHQYPLSDMLNAQLLVLSRQLDKELKPCQGLGV